MTTTTTPTEQHKATVRAFMDIINEGRFDDIETYATSDVAFHPLSAANDNEYDGIEACRAFFTGMRAALPDEHYRIDRLVAEDDIVAAQFTVTGTHDNDLMGLSPTGKSIEEVFFITFRLADEKVAEMWGLADLFGTVHQLGLVPKLDEFLATATPMEASD